MNTYSVNGKVYTDHPLLDEIVYNCKLILDKIVIKNDVLANDSESPGSLKDAELYIAIIEGGVSFNVFPFTEKMLYAYGKYTRSEIVSYLNNKNNIPEEDREDLLKFSTDYFMENYEETNNYYRSLLGLPPYGTDDYNVYIDSSYFPANYTHEIDFSKPLHEFNHSDLAVLETTGKMNEIIESYRGSNYSYLRFLGIRKIDLYTARKASKWDILYIPSAEALVEDRFRELYMINKDIYLKRTYQEAYAFSSTYYEQCMILMLLCQTFNDMIVDVPQWYINRDIFDIRSVQYFLESYGVEFFKEIPLKYQIRIVKNLNKLIKYKSSNKNNTDILEIFSIKNTALYKYYLYKKRKLNVQSDNKEDLYDLEFIQCKMGDTYDNYIKDQIYRTPYDDITYQDKYWDGEDTHSFIKSEHLKRDFTIEPTKYMSVEYKISMKEYMYQLKYLLGLILDSKVDTSEVIVSIPSIQPATDFKLSNLFIFLCLLSLKYDDCGTHIIRPKDNRTIEKPTVYHINHEAEDSYTEGPDYYRIMSTDDYSNWLKEQYPEMYIDKKDKVYGFNMNVDLENLKEVISRRHSKFQFDNGFTLEDLGVDKFIAKDNISSIDELISIYKTNTECYNNLEEKIINECNNKDDYALYNYVYESLFTKEFDYGMYQREDGTDVEYIEDVLKDRDYILYSKYLAIMSEFDIESRKDIIRSIMNDIVSTLEYYLSGDGFEYLFSFTSISSFNALIRYIYLMINFFKSYKVYFLEPYITLVADDKINNNARVDDFLAEKRLRYWKEDKLFVTDSAGRETEFEFIEKYNDNMMEAVDIYGHFDPDPDDDYDYNGMYPDTDEEFKDANGGLVDGTVSIPYIMLNAGKPQSGIASDIWDLNGGSTADMVSYLNVDGGYQYNDEEWRNDHWTKDFVYSLDGGGPSTNQFITNTTHTKVVDRQISSEVKISELTGNDLVVLEDGLYLKDIWISWKDLNDYKLDIDESYNTYMQYMNDIESVLINNGDYTFDERVEIILDYKMANMRYVYSQLSDDTFEDSLKNYTDEKATKLYNSLYNAGPLDWGKF